MNEVSCQILEVFFRALPKKGLPPESLLVGTAVPLHHLRNRRERIDWEDFRQIMSNARQIWSEEELVLLGGAVFNAPAMRAISVIARLLFDALGFYTWVFTKQQGAGDQQFTCVDSTLTPLSPRRLRLDLKLKPGYRGCPEFFLVSKGTFSNMPRVLGLAPANVQMEASETSAEYVVDLPPGGGTFRRAKRSLLLPFTMKAAAQELKSANETLLARYAELEDARRKLSARANQLEVVNALGRELAQHTELKALADTVAALLSDRFGCTGVDLFLVRREGETYEQVLTRGEHAERRVSFELPVAGRSIGRIDAYGFKDPAGENGGLWEALLPSIAIALQNARSFALLREYQENLESRVRERTEELVRTTQQLEESLRTVKQLDRQKTEFFANASHELRTPLTMLVSPLEALLGTGKLGSEAEEEIRTVLRGGYRLIKLINDLLDLSKIEAGRMQLRVGPMDVARVLNETIRPFRVLVQRRQIQLKSDVPADLPLVGDPERLEQVVLNLFSNALKHTPDGGSISVTAGRAGEEVVFAIENSGEGIPEEDFALIFDRFAQSTKSRARRFGSTGLGLPVVKELVELHGGSINVQNRPGAGVTFEVRLPVGHALPGEAPLQPQLPGKLELRQYEAVAESELSPVTPAVEPVLDRQSILVAEDHADLRSFLVRTLQVEFRVFEAADGRAALALAREHLPDLILSDLMMPEMDGAELCRRLKEDPVTAAIPFVLITARGDLDSRISGLALGADDYLVKPFHVEEVKMRLRAQLRLRTLSREVAHREKLAALGVLVAGVAHEVRNPLNGILNALQPVLEQLPRDASESRELVELALEGARRVDKLSLQLLLQSRAGGEGFALVDVAENLSLAIRLLAFKAFGGRKIEVTSNLPADVRVMGDPGALNQVWINLIDNALQVTPEGGKVNVRLSVKEGRVVLEVEDEGPGIPAQNLPKLFNPFFTTKPVGVGTGLGLSVAQGIVQQHGGSIDASNVPPHGARFRVTLPVHDFSARGTHRRPVPLHEGDA